MANKQLLDLHLTCFTNDENYDCAKLDLVIHNCDKKIENNSENGQLVSNLLLEKNAAICALGIRKLAEKIGYNRIWVKNSEDDDASVDVYGIKYWPPGDVYVKDYLFSWDTQENHKVWDLGDPIDYK